MAFGIPPVQNTAGESVTQIVEPSRTGTISLVKPDLLTESPKRVVDYGRKESPALFGDQKPIRRKVAMYSSLN